jgi:hypothetical protein
MRALGCQPTEKFKWAVIGGWIFDNARYLGKMDVSLMAMAIHSAELNRLPAAIASVYEEKIHQAGRTGADGIFIGEDMGTPTGLLFSPKMFRVYFQSLCTQLFGIARDYKTEVFMHPCGQN